MPTKRSKTISFELLQPVFTGAQRLSHRAAAGSRKSGIPMHARSTANVNEYLCAIERNQNGKYNVRVRALFGAGKREGDLDRLPAGRNSHGGWTLPVYFLASSFNAAMRKLEQSLQILQKSEERLRFWSIERNDDPKLAGDLLEDFGLWLDRRREFPRKAAGLGVPREKPVPASLLAPVRRVLADSVAQERSVDRTSLAGD